MTDLFKVVPVALTAEIEQLIGQIADGGFDDEQTAWDMLLAVAPQPPALGGERKIKTYECELPVLPEALTSEAFHMVKLDDHRAHLTPLQAEIGRLKADRDYCKRVAAHNKEMGDQLKARCDELEGLLSRVISGGKLLDDRQPDYGDHVLEADINAALSKPVASEQL